MRYGITTRLHKEKNRIYPLKRVGNFSYDVFNWCVNKKQFNWAAEISKLLIDEGSVAGYFLYAFLLNHFANKSKEVMEIVEKYYSIASNYGLPNATSSLGLLYISGDKYIESNFNKAKYLFKLSFDRGNMEGLYHYSNLKLFDKYISYEDFVSLKDKYEKASKFPILNRENAKNMSIHLKNAYKDDNIKIWNFIELIDKLEKEHKKGYFYRGQVQRYPGPLCSSLDRDYSTNNTINKIGPKFSAYPIFYNYDDRFRNTGELFYFINRCYMNNAELWPESVRLQCKLKDYLIMAYGYTLASALCQQAGYSSEGLDITSSIPVATFFSSYGYNKDNTFDFIMNNDSFGVIYRWKKLPKVNSQDVLNTDFCTSPCIIPTYDILNMMCEEDNACDFTESIFSYLHAINWGDMHDYTQIAGRRPFQLLRIPKSMFYNSRIFKQKAALLLPDYVFSESWYNAAKIENPEKYFSYSKKFDYNLIQDLSDPSMCETFIYRRNPNVAKKYLENNKINSPLDIYDDNEVDLSHLLLSKVVETYFSGDSSWGTIPVEFSNKLLDYGFNYADFIFRLQEIRELRKGNPLKYYFKA